MAEGGEFGYNDLYTDYRLDHDDDDDDDEQEVERTQPFQPSAASTPYNGGKEMEMKTRQREKSGLPRDPEISYQEENTPLLGRRNITDEEIERRLDLFRRDSVTGLLDTTAFDPRENPLSAEEQQIEIQKVKAFI